MNKEKKFISSLHNSTKRNYLKRMLDEKAYCMKIAKKYKLKVITDSAQAPGVLNNNRITGTLADVGGFSLNYHKHIHTGEGGILVTNNFKIYEHLLLIRNHAEAAVVGKKQKDISNMIGYNFRMGEIEAAIGIEQLKKLDDLEIADVDLMIVDTEGYELNVLKGAVETIKKFLPVIVMEIHKNKDLTSRYGYNKFENAKFLTNLGYVAKGYINDEDVIFIKT